MKPSASRPRRPEPRAVRLFHLWENADQLVPFPGLYQIAAQPGGGEALRLDQLNRCTFVYRVTNNFIAELTFADGSFGPATLHARAFGFRFTSIPGHFGLMPPEDAEHLLELHLERKERKFWNDFFFPIDPALAAASPSRAESWLEHYRRLPWHSLRLEQPFGAGFGEPFYKFRKLASRHEFWVGARTGGIREELALDAPAPPP